jgi:glycosyltransferase involved in cell wall biosynthesis
MRRVLVVAPHFPPVSSPDGHRARLSVRHFRELGWEPFVLTVRASDQDDVQDPDLCATLPEGLSVTAVPAISLRWARRIGIGNVALRAWRSLDRAGRHLIERHDIDLVYFSTTMFAAMPLGRFWKRALGVPFVLDIQDPWLSDYPQASPGLKARLARLMHGVLEPFAMRTVDGLVAVSPDYIATLRRRYPWIAEDACATVPFGASSHDFEVARRAAWVNPLFRRGTSPMHAVSVGRGGRDVRTAARIVFRALNQAGAGATARLHFVGTDYAPRGTGRKTVHPVAVDEGIGASVTESTDRVPYLDGLRLMCDADFLVVLGSDDPSYSPSKVYPSLLSGRPILSVLHEDSPVVDLMRRAARGPVITFRSDADIPDAARLLATEFPAFVATLSSVQDLPESVVRGFDAREMARRQCDLFARVLRGSASATVEATCRG